MMRVSKMGNFSRRSTIQHHDLARFQCWWKHHQKMTTERLAKTRGLVWAMAGRRRGTLMTKEKATDQTMVLILGGLGRLHHPPCFSDSPNRLILFSVIHNARYFFSNFNNQNNPRTSKTQRFIDFHWSSLIIFFRNHLMSF